MVSKTESKTALAPSLDLTGDGWKGGLSLDCHMTNSVRWPQGSWTQFLRASILRDRKWKLLVS